MTEEAAAKRYAEAAYLLAREANNEAAWPEGLAAIGALCGDPPARAYLHDTRVSLVDKMKFVETTLSGVDPLVLNLARLLLRRGRTDLGPQIAEAFQQLLDEALGIAHAAVTTAVRLTEDDRRAVEARLRETIGGEVIVKTEVDESILGGIIIRIGDRLIDGSTRSRLQALKQKLEGVAP